MIAYSRAVRSERTTKPSKARKAGTSRGETSSSAWSRAAVTVTVRSRRDALEGVRLGGWEVFVVGTRGELDGDADPSSAWRAARALRGRRAPRQGGPRRDRRNVPDHGSRAAARRPSHPVQGRPTGASGGRAVDPRSRGPRSRISAESVRLSSPGGRAATSERAAT